MPYLVGSYQNVALAIYDYLVNGLSLMVIEIPDTGFEEFHHINEVFSSFKLIEKQKTK